MQASTDIRVCRGGAANVSPHVPCVLPSYALSSLGYGFAAGLYKSDPTVFFLFLPPPSSSFPSFPIPPLFLLHVPSTCRLACAIVAKVLSEMIDNKIQHLFDRQQYLHARFLVGLKPWFMKGLPQPTPPVSEESGSTECGAVGEENTTNRASSEDAAEDRRRLRRHRRREALELVRSKFRWRGEDSEPETAETDRTGLGLIFWSALSDNTDALRALAPKKGAVTQDIAGHYQELIGRIDLPQTTLKIDCARIFSFLQNGLTALHVAAAFASWETVAVRHLLYIVHTCVFGCGRASGICVARCWL
jgi:hypothetical protein